MYANQDPNKASESNVSEYQRRGRNITSQSEVSSSKVYQMYPNKDASLRNNKSKQLSFWKQVKSTVIGTFEYLERRPKMNFGLFAIAQLFAGVGLPSLTAIGVMVIAMTLAAAQVYNSREFIHQGLAICGGLGVARIIQLAITILL